MKSYSHKIPLVTTKIVVFIFPQIKNQTKYSNSNDLTGGKKWNKLI